MDCELGDALLAVYRLSAHRVLGYGSFREYAERILGWTGRQTEERLRVALALEDLPALREALSTGVLSFSAVRELTRVATHESEHEWMAAAEHRSVREIERLVSGRSAGDRPSDPPEPSAERKRIALNVSAQAFAVWEEARERLTRERGGRVDDDALVMELAMRALGGGRDAGKSAYQIAITSCEHCGRAEQRAGAESVVVEPVVLEAARCDAQVVADGRATQTIPPRVRRAVVLRHRRRCGVPGCSHAAFVDLHHVKPRSEGGTHDPDLLIPLCTAHHTHVHEGQLVIRGSYSAGFVFEHTDGTPYGAPTVSPTLASGLQRALRVLASLGFKSGEAQRMLNRARPHVGADAKLDEIVRAALARAELPRLDRVSDAAEWDYGSLAA
ncbi:MAG: hypothetical protein K8H88_22410 [Sandaracinaceae bacterium]|nr:hypothetical protein [Sandaracinaceae bacterium]